VRLVFAGTPEVAVPSLDALVASRHQVVGVVTRPDARRGRGHGLAPSPVGARAEELGIPALKTSHPRDADFLAALRALEPDCCPVVAYGALLPDEALAVPPHGWINLHFSLLPAYRGAAPVQAAIWNGEADTGACTFRIVAALDAGPICASLRTPIGPRETSGQLLDRLAVEGARLLVDTIDAIEDGTAQFRPQAPGGSYAGKIGVDDARVDWTLDADTIDRRIRACTPAPGAWTTLAGQRFRLLEVEPDDRPATAPGLIRVDRGSVHVDTGRGQLRLIRVQPAGKRAMAALDWARGRHADQVRFDG